MALCPFHTSHRKSALEIGQFLRRNFWTISGAPFSPGPFVLLLKRGGVLHTTARVSGAPPSAGQSPPLFGKGALETLPTLAPELSQ